MKAKTHKKQDKKSPTRNKATIINFDPVLKQVVSGENREFIRELKSVGLKEEQIERILRKTYFQNISLFPKDKIGECKRKSNALARSIIHINALLDDDNISDTIKEPLLKELNRLRDLYADQKWIATLDSVKKWIGPGNPKTGKQMIGFQILALYEYLKSLNKHLNGATRDYKAQDIYELIRELLSIAQGVNYTSWKQIKTLHGNAKRHVGPNTMRSRRRTKVSAYEQSQMSR